MKRSLLCAALLAAATPFAMAQSTDAAKSDTAKSDTAKNDAAKAPDVPPPNCGAGPELPGRTMMQDSSVRRRFETEVQKYKECMKNYVDERQAAAKAHTAAGNEAVNQFNAWVKALDDEQKKRRGGPDNEGGAGPATRAY